MGMTSPLDPEFRSQVHVMIDVYEAVVREMRELRDKGWPTGKALDAMPVVVNWVYTAGERRRLEGNIFAPDHDATVRTKTPPIIFQSVEHGLALTVGGWYRTEQQLRQD